MYLDISKGLDLRSRQNLSMSSSAGGSPGWPAVKLYTLRPDLASSSALAISLLWGDGFTDLDLDEIFVPIPQRLRL
jgi:hypothetical protein